MSPVKDLASGGMSIDSEKAEHFAEITMPHLTVQSTNDNLDSMLNVAITYIDGEGE
jgi:hypothetical protein